MKKVLFASTILASLGSVAAAETGFTIGGYGRFGLQYSGAAEGDTESTTIHTRLRLNIDATTETDTGVTFGGRIRLQYDNGSVTGTSVNVSGIEDAEVPADVLSIDSGSKISAATLYMSYEGLRVEVGNANTAIDSSLVIYGSELGLTDSSFGDSRSAFDYFRTGAYSNTPNRMGISASYTAAGFTGMISYIDYDQTTSDDYNLMYDADLTEETQLFLAYATDLFTVEVGGGWNVGGVDGDDMAYIGGFYKLSDAATVGLNYIDEAADADEETTVLYGSYTVDALTLKGYVANNGADSNDTNTAYGIGADYDLGGAKVTGGIQRGYDEETYADVGVRFNF